MQIKKAHQAVTYCWGVSTLSMLLMGCVTDQRMLYSQTADNKSVPYLQPSLYRTFENHSNKHVRRLSPQLKVGGPRNFVLNANRLALLLFNYKITDWQKAYLPRQLQLLIPITPKTDGQIKPVKYLPLKKSKTIRVMPTKEVCCTTIPH